MISKEEKVLYHDNGNLININGINYIKQSTKEEIIEKIEKKYYLKAKDWRVVGKTENISYLNLNKEFSNVFWNNKNNVDTLQTIFTLKEIEELKKISDVARAKVEFCELVEVEE